tara:strand:- start:768 stop:998 length:231 start_codon:yes stop_codon:yes gene_type:complete
MSLLKIKLALITFGSNIVLFLMLCLGAQNLNTRHSLNLGIGKTAPLPNGFILGTSLIMGVLAGGLTTSILIPNKKD